jgi:hypothetical protein
MGGGHLGVSGGNAFARRPNMPQSPSFRLFHVSMQQQFRHNAM